MSGLIESIGGGVTGLPIPRQTTTMTPVAQSYTGDDQSVALKDTPHNVETNDEMFVRKAVLDMIDEVEMSSVDNMSEERITVIYDQNLGKFVSYHHDENTHTQTQHPSAGYVAYYAREQMRLSQHEEWSNDPTRAASETLSEEDAINDAVMYWNAVV